MNAPEKITLYRGKAAFWATEVADRYRWAIRAVGVRAEQLFREARLILSWMRADHAGTTTAPQPVLPRNTCPECSGMMRGWALRARKVASPEKRKLYTEGAIAYREICHGHRTLTLADLHAGGAR